MADQDYLQDPDMWEDKLPQPYKTINKILGDILKDTWTQIEEREVARMREKAQVKIPSGPNGMLLNDSVLNKACAGIEFGENSTIVVGNGTNIWVLKFTEINREVQKVAQKSIDVDIVSELNLKHSIVELKSMNKNDSLIIMAQLETVIKILILIKDTLHEITDIAYLHKEKSSKVLNFVLSDSGCHLVVSYHCPPATDDSIPSSGAANISVTPRSAAKNGGKGSSANKPGMSPASISTDDGVIIALYSIPSCEWVAELLKGIEQNEAQDITFSKIQVMYYIPCPNPLTPCSAATTVTALFQSVCDEKSQILPSGELHYLTEQYVENRWKHFVNKRQNYMPIDSRQPPLKSGDVPTEQHRPTCHFLHYKSGIRQESPCAVGLWWEDQSQLLIYPVKEGGKLPTLPPFKRIPQSSNIVCSRTSEDSSMLALGLSNGVVAVWNMKRNFCLRVVSCTKSHDKIIALDFFHDKYGEHHVGVGSVLGKLLDINLCQDLHQNIQNSIVSFTARTSKQQQIYSDLFVSNEFNLSGKLTSFITDSHYPKLLITLQDDGCVVFWNPSESEAVCKFELGSEGYTFPSSPHYSFTKDGKQLMLIVKKSSGNIEEENVSHVLCLDIFSVPQLLHYWVQEPVKTNHASSKENIEEALMRPVEVFLDEYTRTRYIDDSTFNQWEENCLALSRYLVQEN